MKNHTLIHHFLEYSAELFPDKVALVHEKNRATYDQINSKANQLASFLYDLGIKPQDRIAIIFDNSLEYVISYYGCLKAGCVAAPLNTELKSEGFNQILKELDPRIIIASAKFDLLIQNSSIAALGIKDILTTSSKDNWIDTPYRIHLWDQLLENDTKCINPDTLLLETDLACIIYTSGSTGTPKGVMLTHQNIVTNTNSICKYLELTNHDIQMVVLPFYYVMGKSLLNTHFAMGGRIVINNKFAFPASVINQMMEEQITGFSGVPSTFAYLLHRSPLLKYRDKLTTLRYCSQAGGHMAKQTKLELRETLPAHTKIYIMYGATEASARLSYLPPDQFLDKIESIGIPIPDVKLKVIDSNGNTLKHGEIGELVAEGNNIMQGYWQDPVLTDKVLDKNGYHTGDMAYQDKDGYFFTTGRKDNQLKVGGHRINIQEIEDTLIATGLLIEAAVVGVQDKLAGTKLIALVVPKSSDIIPENILKESSKLLPKYKLPSEIKLIRTLPKKGSGKIDREQCLKIIT